ncbi:MAG: biotin transporter BioY [Ruminococcus sp.]|jgi:biotin transport system substrate-specific component
MKKRGISIENMIKIAMMTAVLAVMSVIQIPAPSGVPFTLQTFGVALCGYMLGAKKGGMAVMLYLIAGMAGLPVFSGMKGGFGVLAGPTGGFLVGFPGMVILSGAGAAAGKGRIKAVLGFLGLCVCHGCGTVWFSLIMNQSLKASFLLVSLPYLAKDIVSVAGAILVSEALKKRLARAGLPQKM